MLTEEWVAEPPLFSQVLTKKSEKIFVKLGTGPDFTGEFQNPHQNGILIRIKIIEHGTIFLKESGIILFLTDGG